MSDAERAAANRCSKSLLLFSSQRRLLLAFKKAADFDLWLKFDMLLFILFQPDSSRRLLFGRVWKFLLAKERMRERKKERNWIERRGPIERRSCVQFEWRKTSMWKRFHIERERYIPLPLPLANKQDYRAVVGEKSWECLFFLFLVVRKS